MKQETDSTIRQSFLAQLVTAQADDVARDLLSELAIDDPDDTIRSFAVTKLAKLWSDDDSICQTLLDIAATDFSGEVRIASYSGLSRSWWKDPGVRVFLRSRTTTESAKDVCQRLERAIESAGSLVTAHWKSKLSGKDSTQDEGERRAQDKATTLPGYPTFRVSQFRLRNIGPFRDTGWVEVKLGVTVFLGDNAAGKTTILRCLALATLGLPAVNEVETKSLSYLRKGAEQGSIEVLFDLCPDPGSLPKEMGCFAVRLQITAGSLRFTPGPSTITVQLQSEEEKSLPNSIEHLGKLRTVSRSQFGFVSGYGATRNFSEVRDIPLTTLDERETAWVVSLFDPSAWPVSPEMLT